MPKHAIGHIEWSSTDLERTKTFLAGLFEWEFQNWGPEYITFRPKEGPGGGLMKVDRVKAGSSPVVYIEVEEIEPLLNKAKELGGGVAVPKTEISGMGWYAHLTDPDGNIVGLYQEGS
jgi:predicted enzyme related to lactoylglutathione lyase